MSGSRPNCLIVLSGAIEGVSAHSFIQAFTLAQNALNVHIASPNGRQPEFIHQDDHSRRWLNEFLSKSTSKPIKLDTVDPEDYGCIIIPDSSGAVHDLGNSTELANIISHMIDEKKPICAVGMGVAALVCARDQTTKQWKLSGYSMTSTSVYELARTPYFGSIPIILEDFIKDNGATYTSSDPDEVHVVLDRHLVTGQNTASTYMAVQTFIILINQRLKKLVA